MDNQPQVYHRRVPSDAWIDEVERFADRVSFLYAEEPAGLYLEAYRRPEAAWAHGRAFGPALEVRWTQRRDGFADLLLLSEDEPCPQGWQPLSVAEDGEPLPVDAVEESATMLAGMHRRHLASTHHKSGKDAPHEWIETRLPRPLVYPIAETRNPDRWVRLRTRVYRVRGRPVLSRMLDLEGTDHVKPL